MSNIIDTIRLSGTDYTLSATTSGVSVVEVTQAQYDALPTSAKTDTSKMYVITDAEAGDLTNYYTKTETNSAIAQAVSGKQDTLVSGTNIKTINNESLLGSGNIDIQGGGKAIEAGRGIAITTGETADTVSLDINAKKGSNTTALVFNYTNANTATEAGATSFGYMCKATNQYTFANGNNTQAKGYYSHSEGESTIANGWGSHSDGQYTNANGKASHTEGSYVNADNDYESSQGRYNVSNKANTTFGDSGNTLFSVGNGTADDARHNAFEIRQNGDIYLTLDGQDVKLQDQLGGGTVSTAITSGDTNAVAGGAVYDRFNEVEQVTAQALNVLNDRLDEDEEVTAAALNVLNESLSGKQDTLSAGTNITIVDNVISATGGGAVSSAITSGDTNAVAGGAVYDKFDEVEQVTAEALNVLNEALSGKADSSAVYLKSETSGATEISTALATKQNQLTPGSGISIDSNNVISVTGGGGGGGTVESAITSGSTNAVESKAIWSAVTYDVSINETLEFDNTYAATNYPSGCNSVTFENSNGDYLPTGDYVFTSGGSEVAKLTCSVISWWPYEVGWASSDPKLTYASEGYSAVTVSYSELAGDIDGVTVPSTFTNTFTATASGENHLWINENTYRKDEVYNKSEINVLSGVVDTKLDATAYTPTIVDSALNVASRNPVQNQTLYSELRLSDGGEAETTLTFEGNYTTNYPNGCTKIKVECSIFPSNSNNSIIFNDKGGYIYGYINVTFQQGNITVDISNFQGATYEISGYTVIISYPTVTTVTKLNVNPNQRYTYKAITSSTTPLKDKVVENTTALGGLSLVKLTQAQYDALATKDNSTLYVIVG